MFAFPDVMRIIHNPIESICKILLHKWKIIRLPPTLTIVFSLPLSRLFFQWKISSRILRNSKKVVRTSKRGSMGFPQGIWRHAFVGDKNIELSFYIYTSIYQLENLMANDAEKTKKKKESYCKLNLEHLSRLETYFWL